MSNGDSWLEIRCFRCMMLLRSILNRWPSLHKLEKTAGRQPKQELH
jgi:hypothetical protein